MSAAARSLARRRSIEPRHVGALLLVLVAAYPLLAGETTTRRFVYIALLGIAALSLSFTLGVAGEFAIGQAGIFAAGAYLAAILTTHFTWPLWIAVIAATAFGGVVGMIVAVPGLRVGGWSFAMTSLLVAVAIPEVARLVPEYSGGDQGLAGVPIPAIGGHELTVTELYLISAGSALLLIGLLWRIQSSIYGLAFAGMRNSHVGADANGISTVGLRLAAYLLSSLMAGFAGAIYVHIDGFVSPDSFPLSLTIELIAAAVIGGLGTLTGPIIGIGVLQYLPDLTSSFNKYALLIYGALLVTGMLLIPRGLVRTLGDGWRSVLGRRTQAGAAAGGLEDWALREHRFDPSGIPVCERPRALRVEGISKAFGGVTALQDVDLVAEPGAITAVIGANGSGKTTLLNVVSGYYRVDAGTASLGDEVLTGARPHRIARGGLSRTFQTPILIPDRSVLDNVVCAAFQHREASLVSSVFHTPRSRRDLARMRGEARSLLAALGLDDLADVAGGVLPPGEQRLVEVAMAVARRPSAILLDEPAAGLIGAEATALSTVLRALRDRGYTVLLIEHNVAMVMDVADRIVVLERGRVIADGEPETVRNDQQVIESYLGASA